MNLFELYATLSLDKSDYESGLTGAESSASKIGSKISSGLGALAKGTAVAIGATTTAVSALVKSSVESYADFEQLIGGVQTLFGEISKTTDASTKVIVNAGNAYKTAGMSANEYMETVTSFSASLMSALDMDAEKASAQADKAIIMMADNANKMGTSMESIQNAYMGFAKQNYTMLDNLKLGYGGTKEEMQRLLSDAEKMPEAMGRKFDLNNYSDLIDAIGLVQDKMGITGTTAKEASTTISGSLNSLKAIWSNVVTDFASANGDLGDDLINLTEAFMTFAKNVVPVVEEAIQGIAYAIQELAPVIVEEIPKVLDETLPTLIDAGVALLQSIIDGIVNNIDVIMDAVFLIVEQVAKVLLDNFPVILDSAIEVMVKIVEGIAQNMPLIVDKLIEVTHNIVDKISEALENPETLTSLFEAVVDIAVEIARLAIETIPIILEALPEILMAIVSWITTEAIPSLLEAVSELWNMLFDKSDELTNGFFTSAIENLKAFLEDPAYYIGLAIGEIIGNLILFFKDVVDKTVELFTVTLPQKWRDFEEDVKELPQKLADFFEDLPEKFKEIGKNVIEGLWNGLKEKWTWLTEQVNSLVNGLIDGVKNTLGIKSPSKVFAGIGRYMTEGLAVGWKDSIEEVKKNITNDLDFSAESFGITADVNGSAGGNGTVFNQIINVNQEIATADELAQAVRIESRYGLMKGVALG